MSTEPPRLSELFNWPECDVKDCGQPSSSGDGGPCDKHSPPDLDAAVIAAAEAAEDERALDGVEEELAELSRLALHASRRDVEMYVHRLAYRHRRTPLGQALSSYDVVPGVSLRAAEPPVPVRKTWTITTEHRQVKPGENYIDNGVRSGRAMIWQRSPNSNGPSHDNYDVVVSVEPA